MYVFYFYLLMPIIFMLIQQNMNKTNSLLLTVIFFIFNNAVAQYTKTIEIFGYPEDFYILSDRTLLIYDPQRNNEEVCILSINTAEISSCIRKGKGPGEISGNLTHFFVNQNKEEMYIWDGGSRRLSLFSNELQYIQTVPLPTTQAGNNIGATYRIPLGNGDEFLVDSFRRGVFGNYYTASDMEITSIPIATDLIEPAKTNPFLLQGKYTVDWNSNSMIFTCNYSSLILKISNAEVEYITLGEPNILFPENEEEMSIPAESSYTYSSIDTSIDEDFIYILHSGKKAKLREQIWYELRGRDEELYEKMASSNTILVYDLKTGGFVKKIALEEEVYKAKAFNGVLYTLKRGKEDAQLEIRTLQ